MPAVHTQTGLECVVGRAGRGFFLVDVEEIGENGPRHVEIYAIRTVEAANRTIGRRKPKTLPSRSRRRVKSRDLSLAGLTNVKESPETMPLRPNVADLQYCLAGNLLLDIQVVVFYVRRLDIPVDAEYIAFAAAV